MKIKLNKENRELMEELSSKFNIPFFTSAIFSRRGIKKEEIKYYLEKDTLYEHSPFLVDDVYSAIERVNDALPSSYDENGENIFIFGDKDADGITSSAIIYKTLKKLGSKNVITRLPRESEGYGLSDKIVEEIIESGSTLCITVDNGVTAIEEIKKLESNGVDVIVLDHHIPYDKLPPAVAIFDPKVPGNGYPFDGLSGSEVTSKFCWALLFSHTSLFNSRYILLHSLPGNDTIKVEAIKIEDLVVTDSLYEEFLVENIGREKERMLSFLSCNVPIVVFDKDLELPLLKKVFGNSIDFSLYDFRPDLERLLPRLKGKSLYELSLESRGVKYTEGEKEMATLLSLFQSVSIHREKSLCEEFDEIRVLESIGAIADLMPIIDENRLIIKRGLELLSTKTPPTLSFLLSRQELINTPLSVKDISFKIAPVLNASGRLGKAEKALSLLLSEDKNEIFELTEELLLLNKERQTLEEEAMKSISTKAENSYLVNEKKYVLVSDDTLPKNLTGSIANKLLSLYKVPIVVLSGEEDICTGSVRCLLDMSAKEFLSSLSYLLLDYGGHDRASGFKMEKKNKDEFFKECALILTSLEENGKEREVEVDAILDEVSIVENGWKTLSFFSPYGQESEELKYYIEGAKVEEVKELGHGGEYMKLLIRFGEFAWPCMWWEVDKSKNIESGSYVNLVFTPEYNYFRGQKKEQMKVVDIEKV